MGQSLDDSQDGTGIRGTFSSLRSPLMVDAAPPSSPQWRVLILFLLLFLSVGFSLVLRETSPQIDQPITSFLHMWLLSFVPYLVACAFVLWTKPLQGYGLWAELGLLFFGALLLRALLLPLPPCLSHDSWRYVWDARVLAHGYSPYVDAPGANIYLPLRNFIYDNSRFRNVPTIYLPVAQSVYLLSYLLAPNNLFTLKGLFLLCDLVTCGALSWLLARKGLDPRRMIIYAWCPLPIVEYALQGHVDPLTIMLTVLAVVCATSTQHRARVLAGVVIALAALTKIYPILLLAVVLRRRDGGLLLACTLTILVAYLPFLLLGHGQVLGFLPTYINEQGDNAGVIQWSVRKISPLLDLSLSVTQTLELAVDLVVVSTMAVTIWLLRQHERISMEGAALVVIGTIFAVSSHVFPWYVPAVLPWVALLLSPLWMSSRLSGKGLAITMVWYFATTVPLAYLLSNPLGWPVYYLLVYDVVLGGLALAAVAALVQGRSARTAHWHEKESMTAVFTGNASVDGAPSRGWFIGHFLTNAHTLGSTRTVEVKWSAYQAGEERPQWGTSEKITLCVLIKGRIRLMFPSQECLLAHEGDYVIWQAGLPYSWRIEEDALVLTMRWLAPTDLYREALSQLFCTLKARAASFLRRSYQGTSRNQL